MVTEQLDNSADDDAVTAQRARAKAELDQIAKRVKQALADAAINLDLFFLIPNSGDAFLTFGTTVDPPDDQWDRVADIVEEIVRATVGLRRTRSRPVVCASTDSLDGTDGKAAMPIFAPLPVLDAGADRT